MTNYIMKLPFKCYKLSNNNIIYKINFTLLNVFKLINFFYDHNKFKIIDSKRLIIYDNGSVTITNIIDKHVQLINNFNSSYSGVIYDICENAPKLLKKFCTKVEDFVLNCKNLPFLINIFSNKIIQMDNIKFLKDLIILIEKIENIYKLKKESLSNFYSSIKTLLDKFISVIIASSEYNDIIKEFLKISLYELNINNYKIYVNKLINLLLTNDKLKYYMKFNEKYDKICYDKSKEIYYSFISTTNWVDELEYGLFMGLLINMNPKEINKKSYDLNYIPIKNITHTILCVDQLFEAFKVYKSKYNTINDCNKDEKIISGFGIGNGNCLIPLYINKNHWNFVNIYLDNILGLNFNRDGLVYHENYKLVYYNLFIKMVNLTFTNKDYNSDKWIYLLFSVLRTAYQINSKNKNLNKKLFEYIISKTDNYFSIVEDLIRSKFKTLFKSVDIIDKLYKFKGIEDCLDNDKLYINYNDVIDENELNNWIEHLESNNIFSESITTIISCYNMRSFLRLYDYKFIFNDADKNGGIISDYFLKNFKYFVKTNFIEQENSNLTMILNPKFRKHINKTKIKKFSIYLLLDNKIYLDKEQIVALLIQCLMTRVKKVKKKAIKNEKYLSPFYNSSKIINNIRTIAADRRLKSLGLKTIDDYIGLLNRNSSLSKLVLNKISKLKAK